MQIRWLDVLRDALAIVIASALVRMVAIGAEVSDTASSLLLLGCFAVGFCVAGCLSPQRRFTHLGYVAFATWLILALYGAITGSGEPSAYLLLLFNPTLLAMLLGGVASLAIVRRPSEPPRGQP